jgi:sulfite exporter TauE/SafE
LFVSRKLALWRPVTALVERLKSSMSVLLRQRSLESLVLLGLLNGLLPCGLVYVACAGAVAAGGITSGVAYMAAFGAGTVPMLLGITLTGQLVPLTLRLRLRKAIPVSVFLLAAILVLRGMSLGIPYLSPDLSGGSASCCHH